jgi:S1-C subfamily serine protease
VSSVTKKKWRCIKLETKQNRYHVFPVIVIAAMLAVSFVCTASVYNLNEQVSSLQSEVAILQSAAETAAGNQDNSITSVSNTESVSLSDLYEQVENSVVTIQSTIVEYTMPFGRQVTAEAQGSGFVYDYEGQMVIITNNHVVEGAASITVTFADGNTYDVKVLGADTPTDLAVLSTSAPASEYYPLEIVSSSTVRVGDYVVAIGSPYGLAGTMTTGIVSALNRTITITEDVGSSYDITGLIQTSAPINSGNSGGPLMTYDGQVIGITTAIVSNSDGLGFAVPSDTILTTIETLLA